MSLEEVGANPIIMAKALNAQLSSLGYNEGKVPIYQAALSLDIKEIRVEASLAFEGMILMPSNKSVGSVLINQASKPRMRFTLAHELFHFLSPLHKPVGQGGFTCDKAALKISSHRTQLRTRYERQEAEANQFAAEILMPRSRIKRRLGQEPSLEHVLAMADEFHVSKEAAAVHYASLHDDAVGIIFSRNGRVRYAVKSEDCPWLVHAERGAKLPSLIASKTKSLSLPEEFDANGWTTTSQDEVGDDVQIQTLYQDKGYAMSLLWFAEFQN